MCVCICISKENTKQSLKSVFILSWQSFWIAYELHRCDPVHPVKHLCLVFANYLFLILSSSKYSLTCRSKLQWKELFSSQEILFWSIIVFLFLSISLMWVILKYGSYDFSAIPEKAKRHLGPEFIKSFYTCAKIYFGFCLLAVPIFLNQVSHQLLPSFYSQKEISLQKYFTNMCGFIPFWSVQFAFNLGFWTCFTPGDMDMVLTVTWNSLVIRCLSFRTLENTYNLVNNFTVLIFYSKNNYIIHIQCIKPCVLIFNILWHAWSFNKITFQWKSLTRVCSLF